MRATKDHPELTDGKLSPQSKESREERYQCREEERSAIHRHAFLKAHLPPIGEMNCIWLTMPALFAS